MFPLFREYQSRSKNSYYADFREFIYTVEIHQQKGYSLILDISKHKLPEGEEIDRSLLIKKVDHCLKWSNHLIQKVIQNEPSFAFMRITDRNVVSHIAVSDENNTAFIASAHKPGHESIEKSLILENTNRNMLGFQRRARMRKKVEDITRDDCMIGWKQHLDMLRALRNDINRIPSVPDNPFMSQSELNDLRKRVVKMGIGYSILQDGKPGIRIGHTKYYSYKGADLFLASLQAEHNAKIEPGYSVFLDK